jgi:hypothetical protein
VTSVVYSKITSTNALGIWNTNPNPLSVARQSAAGIWANNYIYVMGGFDGTTTLPTSIDYASGARVLIFGGLDLLNLTGQGLGDYGGGGTLTAGNTRIVGDLRVEGFTDLNNGLSVDSSVNINAVSATAGQTILNINNNLANSIFSVKHMSTGFGSLASAGAFISTTSMFADEFVTPKQNTAITADSFTNVIGDSGAWGFDTFTGTATTYSTPASIVGGVGRISFPATSGTGAVLAISRAVGAHHGIYLKANLPVVQMKIKPSRNAATDDTNWGLMAVATAASGTNDAQTTDGIFFASRNGTSWVGVVRSGSADVGTVTCPGTISTAQFSTGRIVVETSSQVHFYMDYDASDGINFIDCGIVAVNTSPTVALTLAVQNTHTLGSTMTLDIDYMRTWQDDAPMDGSVANSEPAPLQVESAPNVFDGRVALADLMTVDENLAYDPAQQLNTQTLIASKGIVTNNLTTDKLTVNFLEAATDADIKIALGKDGKLVVNNSTGQEAMSFDGEGNATFQGTLTADAIVANKILGLEIFTNQLSGIDENVAVLSDKLNVLQAVEENIDLSTLGILEKKGGLTIAKETTFKEATVFEKLVTLMGNVLFRGEVSFEKIPTFNQDTAGYAVVKEGAQSVTIKFENEYTNPPVVNATLALLENQNEELRLATEELLLTSDVKYIVSNVTTKGFDIKLANPILSDVPFSWQALAVKDAKTFESQELAPVADGTEALGTSGDIPVPSEIIVPNQTEQTSTVENMTPISYLPVADAAAVVGSTN